MTTKSVRGGRVGAALVLSAVVSASPHALAAQAQQPLGGVEQALSYYVEGGGRWRQSNEDFEPGSGAPTHWVRVMEWGPNRDVVIADAFAVFESRRCESIIHMVYRWDPEEGRVATVSFGASGMLGVGYVESLGPEQDRVVGLVTLPDGTEVRIRDTSDLSRHEEYTTLSERWADGDWVAGGDAHWLRDPHEEPCSPPD